MTNFQGIGKMPALNVILTSYLCHCKDILTVKTLIDANNIFKQKWFFQTAEMLEELTGLKKDKQKRIAESAQSENRVQKKK